MTCPKQEICGGCVHRSLSETEYRDHKIRSLKNILSGLSQTDINFGEPIFIGDGVRRRANFAFTFKKGKLSLGFNRFHSDEIIDISTCPLLLPQINSILPNLRNLLQDLCALPILPTGRKNKKKMPQLITKGDVYVCAVSNGIDIVLEIDCEFGLEHRMVVFDWVQQAENIIRISHRHKPFDNAEPLIEKSKPQVSMGGCSIYVPAGTFLQASAEGEKALVDLVIKYIGDTRGKIADLFCGVGTFSYPLSKLDGNKIISADSSHDLLSGFRHSINTNMLSNIEVLERNLFKYPFVGDELKGLSALVFDPPRAGAEAQVRAIASLPFSDLPHKIIAVSCNPHSFVKDAEVLLNCGYEISEITLVDQFAYSNHSELVALFTLKK